MNNRADEIYKSITKKQIRLLFLAGAALGFVIFLIIYGPDVLDFTNDEWLILNGGDISQHYIGWKAYRITPWQFPIGMTEGLLYPESICVIYTDSIPLFAIIFKLLSPILPQTFQYMGLWGAITFCLMGGISAMILRKATYRPVLCILGSVFFSFSPYVIQRMFNHTALASNWIILLAIAIWVYRPYFSKISRKIPAWCGLLAVASLVHIYYVPMVLVFMVFWLVQDIMEKSGWKSDIIMIAGTLGSVVFLLWAVGAFTASPEAVSNVELGVYNANLNTFWSGGVFSKTPKIRKEQEEGFGYLGLGIIIIGLCVAAVTIVSKIRRIHGRRHRRIRYNKLNTHRAPLHFVVEHSFGICVAAAFFVFLWLAVMPAATFNGQLLFNIEYPDWLESILSIFRGQGRFIWNCSYIIMFLVLAYAFRYLQNISPVMGIALICAALSVQISDICVSVVTNSDCSAANRKSHTDIQERVMKSEQWEDVAEGKSHIVYLPYNISQDDSFGVPCYEMADFAIDHGMTVNYFLCARLDEEACQDYESSVWDDIVAGKKDYGILYILAKEADAQKYGMEYTVIDGILVAWFEPAQAPLALTG